MIGEMDNDLQGGGHNLFQGVMMTFT